MIDRGALLSDLQKLLKQLEDDLMARSDSAEVPEVQGALRAEYARAIAAERTAQSYGEWRSDYATQVAVAWVLNAVFARFLEDNGLVEGAKLSGAGEKLQRSRDEHEAYFRARPLESDREYLLAVFRELGTLPGMGAIFVENNPVFELPNWLSGDAAQGILSFFQRIDAETGALVHDFTDENLDGVEPFDTRFLGDLYQDLSVEARKRYALLQTPIFVEEFILDRTLDPAIEEFGLEDFRMIDPACGSGHFLLGAFERILDWWRGKDKHTNDTALAQRALDAVHGVDVNPYAVAISRFRLLLAAMKASGIAKLKNAPGFKFKLACGDSLLHGEGSQLVLGEWAPMAHHFQTEDIAALNGILRSGYFHAVVANPPYIVPRDKALKSAHKKRYLSCFGKYPLAVPFIERVFQLSFDRGFIGCITTNSFMKRGFGVKIVTDFFPEIDLTHIIDTSGAYIPGHGTPTAILFGRHRSQVAKSIRTVMGIRGEPKTPENPQLGLVWSSIVDLIDKAQAQNEFIAVQDVSVEAFRKHPWSIGGGGAKELKDKLDSTAFVFLRDHIDEIGMSGVTGADEVMMPSNQALRRKKVESSILKHVVVGENVRDWLIYESQYVLYPYQDEMPIDLKDIPNSKFWLWEYKTVLGNRTSASGKSYFEEKVPWWTWRHVAFHRTRTPLYIAYPEVATHNHFVYERGRKLFKQSSPILKLSAEATEDDYLALLGIINSSTVCFWLKQVCFPKGGDYVGSEGARIRKTLWDERYAFSAANVADIPMPRETPLSLAKRMNETASNLEQLSPSTTIDSSFCDWAATLDEMCSLQEEIDWECYYLYKLVDENVCCNNPPDIKVGQRAFEVAMARQMSVGKLDTTWFKRHNSTPITKLPPHWPDDYKQLVERRIRLIETNKNIRLIEQPEYKRRWNTESWDSQLNRALQTWFLTHLESCFDLDGRMNESGTPTADPLLTTPTLISTGQLTDLVRQSEPFLKVGELYRNDPTFNVQTLVDDLINQETVPLLPSLRYKPTGLRKRADWEHTWNLQRLEDAGEPVETIPVPPKYATSDFAKPHYWKLRGKLDVPKERWVSFPHCEGPDGFPTVAWAGYDPLQMSGAIANYYVRVQEDFGGTNDPRLIPLLGCLLELIPWVQQWHNDPNPDFNGLRMGDYYLSFVTDEAQQLGKTLDDIRDWQPPAKPKKTKKSKRKQ